MRIEIFKSNFERKKYNSRRSQWLDKKFTEYKVKDKNIEELKSKKMDIIPPSIALAQAAYESGWGNFKICDGR